MADELRDRLFLVGKYLVMKDSGFDDLGLGRGPMQQYPDTAAVGSELDGVVEQVEALPPSYAWMPYGMSDPVRYREQAHWLYDG